MTLPHKDIVFPEVDLSHDEGDPEWAGTDIVPVPGQSHYRWLRPPGLHAQVWGYTQADWQEAAAAYEAEPESFYASWYYLNNHPVYWRFHPHEGHPPNSTVFLEHEYGFGSDAINVMVVRVCAKCRRIHEEDGPYEEKTEIWLETGKWDMLPGRNHPGHTHWHDTELDCGGDTYEEAVVKLARLVWEKYGNDRRIADADDDAG